MLCTQLGFTSPPRSVSVAAAMTAATRPSEFLDRKSEREHLDTLMTDVRAGEPRQAVYDAVPRVTATDPQAAAVGATEARFGATMRRSDGYLTLLAIRARVPLEVLADTIQPASSIYAAGLEALRSAAPRLAGTVS